MSHQPMIIDDDNFKDHLSDREVDGHRGYGLVPRTHSPDPGIIMPMQQVQMDLIPESEWVPRIQERAAKKQRNVDIWRQGNAGKPIPFAIQYQWGYCWGHGPNNATRLLRAMMNMPFRALSAFSVCGPIKNGKDEGGWGAQALEYMLKTGCTTEDLWPANKVGVPETPEIKASRAANRLTGTWMDLTDPVWDRNLSKAQVMTLLLNNTPLVGDFNWWGHCVAMLDPVLVGNGTSTSDIGILIVNSWEQWGGYIEKYDGMAVLAGSKAWPDNGVAPKEVIAA